MPGVRGQVIEVIILTVYALHLPDLNMITGSGLAQCCPFEGTEFR